MGLVAAYMVGRSEIPECGTTFRWVYAPNLPLLLPLQTPLVRRPSANSFPR